eukprot:scaffold7349_cov173-Amphora_coffeaeformis.AAC.25
MKSSLHQISTATKDDGEASDMDNLLFNHPSIDNASPIVRAALLIILQADLLLMTWLVTGLVLLCACPKNASLPGYKING